MNINKPLEWTNKKPTVPGIYLRNNPEVKSIVRQDVLKVDGDIGTLVTILKDSSDTLISMEFVSDAFLWYGPIPTSGLPRWNEEILSPPTISGPPLKPEIIKEGGKPTPGYDE